MRGSRDTGSDPLALNRTMPTLGTYICIRKCQVTSEHAITQIWDKENGAKEFRPTWDETVARLHWSRFAKLAGSDL